MSRSPFSPDVMLERARVGVQTLIDVIVRVCRYTPDNQVEKLERDAKSIAVADFVEFKCNCTSTEFQTLPSDGRPIKPGRKGNSFTKFLDGEAIHGLGNPYVKRIAEVSEIGMNDVASARSLVNREWKVTAWEDAQKDWHYVLSHVGFFSERPVNGELATVDTFAHLRKA